tara:strand:+ start:17892 stop:19748 length:1857 start_codon:yes stop_codon:yes gene_type:complete
MPNTATVNVNILDLSFSVSQITKGIVFMEGITERGPIANPNQVFRNFNQFQRVYGGLLSTTDFPHLAKRALDGGAALRVSRIAHYTDITDPSTLTALKADLALTTRIVFDAAIVTGNTYNVIIDGVPVSVPFNTDNDTTLADIATAITALGSVNTAYVRVPPSTSGTIIVIPEDATNVLSMGLGNAGEITGGATQAGVTKNTHVGILDEHGNLIFSAFIKYEGADYNNVTVHIYPASNGNANAFNLGVQHTTDSNLNESYPNLLIIGSPQAAISHYLDDVIIGSQLIDITYGDLSSYTQPVRPMNQAKQFNGGSDGGTVTIQDYVGDSVGTGLHTFDPYDDSMVVMAPEISDSIFNQAGSVYAAGRRDLQFFAHLPNASTTETALISARATTAIDTPYASIFAGGLKVVNPITGLTENISELGDVAYLSTRAEHAYGAWRSFSGPELGVMGNVVGTLNNFGGQGQQASLNALANREINMVVDRFNKTLLWDCYSGQQSYSKLSQNGVVRLLIFIEKSLRPTLERYLQQPNDFGSWKQLAGEVTPFLDYLKSTQARALFDYKWDGDQDKTNLDDLSVNNATDVGLGKYKVDLYLNIIPAMVELTLNITVTPSNISFSSN